MTDKRVDPATGSAVTYTELVATYKKQYKRREIEDPGLATLCVLTRSNKHTQADCTWHLVKHCLHTELFNPAWPRIIGRLASQQSRRSRRPRLLQRSRSPRRLPSQNLRPRPRRRQRQRPRMARRRKSLSPKPRLPPSQRRRWMTRHPGCLQFIYCSQCIGRPVVQHIQWFVVRRQVEKTRTVLN